MTVFCLIVPACRYIACVELPIVLRIWLIFFCSIAARLIGLFSSNLVLLPFWRVSVV